MEQIGCDTISGQQIGGSSWCVSEGTDVYFGGKLIAETDASGQVLAPTDRLGTVRGVNTNGTMAQPTYYPYGEPKTAGGIDRQQQFATYVRDSTPSAQDYAMQRYYSNVTGRFFSPDRGGVATANLKKPGSWNRYAYALGDPANFGDPTGRIAVAEDCGDEGSDCGGDPCDEDGDCSAAPDPCSGGGYPPMHGMFDPFEDVEHGQRDLAGYCGYTPAPPTPPPCNNNSTDSQFLATNYGAAESLTKATGVQVDWILAWAASESGNASGWGQSGLAIDNQNYFGQTTSNWRGAVRCGKKAIAGYACCSGFAASATSALDTVHANWTFNGANNVTAAQILTSFGGNVAAAFQAVATAGQVAPNDPNFSSYGANVAGVLPGVDARLNCLGLAH
jgi:RHS repeat-associated protein